MRVCDVMTRSVVTTTPATPVKDATFILAGHGVTLLPVIDETDRLVGVLTEADVMRGRIPPDPRRGAWRGSQGNPPPPTDLVRTIARDDALIGADVRKRREGYGVPDRWTVHVRHGSVTITDQYPDPADHHIALVLAQAVPGVAHAEVVHSTSQRT